MAGKKSRKLEAGQRWSVARCRLVPHSGNPRGHGADSPTVPSVFADTPVIRLPIPANWRDPNRSSKEPTHGQLQHSDPAFHRRPAHRVSRARDRSGRCRVRPGADRPVRRIDKHPAVIIRVEDANEVARVIQLARETGLELAVRSGGHSNAGHSTTEGGIVLDLSPMKAIEIDDTARTAWAQAWPDSPGAEPGGETSIASPSASGIPGRSGSAASPPAAASVTWCDATA